MKFTLPWLLDHLETDANADEIGERLTALGLEVEDITDPAATLAGFTVAHVREAKQHPNADRLRLCEVETTGGVMQVVCGAPNARTGMFGIFAPEGSTIPATGTVLTRATIRGVESNGMLCSARELGIGEDHDGIIDLEGSLEIGTPAAAALGIEGPLFDIAITPDRSDCFGVRGIARDLAAAGVGKLKPLAIDPVPSLAERGPAITLEFPPDAQDACPQFAGRIVRGCRNGPSPAWMQARLKSIGLRPISALVDITNYVMMDLGRPLHVFDAGKVEGDLVIRLARKGESLLALDGKTYELDETMTVIADDNGPEGLGGIMGGEVCGVTEATTDVILEVALFDPIRTAQTGRKLGIESDARTRFERGLDTAFVADATEHATRLIQQLCGGEAGEPVLVGAPPAPLPTVDFTFSQLQRLGGITMSPPEIETRLAALGFGLEPIQDGLSVQPPSWRHDVSTSACIVEELLRLQGYDLIPPIAVTRLTAVSAPVQTPAQRRRSITRRALAEQGLAEAVTWSFTSENAAGLFASAAPEGMARLQNPISSDLSVMRPSLLCNLLQAASANINKGQQVGGLFEVGPRFLGPDPGQQAMGIAALRFGFNHDRHWRETARPVDLFDAKADLTAVLSELGLPVDAMQVSRETPSWYHPGRSGALGLGPSVIATFGELHPAVLRAFDIETAVVALEFDLESLPRTKTRSSRARSPLEQWPYPPADRDFAFIVDQDVAAADLLRVARSVDKKRVRDVQLFDVYTGTGIEPGKKSLALRIRFQSQERTLTDEDVEGMARKFVAACEKQLQAQLRA